MKRYGELARRVREGVLEADGATSAGLRRAVEARAAAHAGRPAGGELEAVPEPVATFVDTIARHAHRATDADVAGLRAAGYSEDAVFEIMAAAALGAGLGRLERGLSVLRGGE